MIILKMEKKPWVKTAETYFKFEALRLSRDGFQEIARDIWDTMHGVGITSEIKAYVDKLKE